MQPVRRTFLAHTMQLIRKPQFDIEVLAITETEVLRSLQLTQLGLRTLGEIQDGSGGTELQYSVVDRRGDLKPRLWMEEILSVVREAARQVQGEEETRREMDAINGRADQLGKDTLAASSDLLAFSKQLSEESVSKVLEHIRSYYGVKNRPRSSENMRKDSITFIDKQKADGQDESFLRCAAHLQRFTTQGILHTLWDRAATEPELVPLLEMMAYGEDRRGRVIDKRDGDSHVIARPLWQVCMYVL